jgi:hypothetical protein
MTWTSGQTAVQLTLGAIALRRRGGVGDRRRLGRGTRRRGLGGRLGALLQALSIPAQKQLRQEGCR